MAQTDREVGAQDGLRTKSRKIPVPVRSRPSGPVKSRPELHSELVMASRRWSWNPVGNKAISPQSADSAPNATNDRHCALVAVAPPTRLGASHPSEARRDRTVDERAHHPPPHREVARRRLAGYERRRSRSCRRGAWRRRNHGDRPGPGGLPARSPSSASSMATRFLRPSPIRSSPKPASACAWLSASRRWAVSPDSGTGSASPEAVGSDWEVTKSQDHRARHCRSIDTLPACDARAT